MKLTIYPTAAAFLDAVRPTLGEREAEHHLVLGLAEAATNRSPNGDVFAATVQDTNGLAVTALMTDGDRPLLIASDRADLAVPAEMLWNALATAGRRPTHVIGAVGQVDAVIEEWARRESRSARVVMNQRVYKLTAVDPQPLTSGTFRIATPEDLDVVNRWVFAFNEEALEGVLPQDSRGVAARRIAAGEVYLWCDPEPRTMAASARPTKRAIVVNAVYTPPEWRRAGYATACVAELSALLLRRGFEFCVLYTDLSNPTSNAIYTRIGYRPVRDFLMYELPGG